MQDEKLGSIYLITSPSGGRYVGKTEKGVEKRWRDHTYKANKGGRIRLHTAIRKYGPDSFTVEEICSDVPVSILSIIEMAMINLLQTFGEGHYNMTEGGEGTSGHKKTQETIDRTSRANKGKKRTPEFSERLRQVNLGRKHSPETRKKISELATGRPAHNKGVPRTEAQKQIQSLLMKGRTAPNKGVPMSPEQREKLKNRKRAPEHQANLTGALKGRKGPNKGVPMSEEQRSHLSQVKTGVLKTHCRRGHPLTPDNRSNDNGKCKVCVKARAQARRKATPILDLAVAA